MNASCPEQIMMFLEVEVRRIMLDLFYVAVVIVFFVLLWSFTKASERL